METNEIRVTVFVEGDPNKDFVEMTVNSSMKIKDLKYEAFKLTQIPMFLQKWTINDKIPERDNQILEDFDVYDWNSNTFFLLKEKLEIPGIKSSPVESNNNTLNPNLNYSSLLKLSNRPLVVNSECFDCPICYTDTDPGDGVVLRSCLHSFCRDCITKTIQFSEDVAVKCPFINDDYKCEGFLEEREIKSLLSTDLWEKHLEKSIKLAQGNIENVFYCRTPNCKGWCVFEDDVNEFKCPICQAKNCLNCRAIHPEYTCQQYQDVVTGGDTETKAELERMVARGEAMHCPKCKIVIMKKIGCDWMQCLMCRTEICWATRGPRWGPKGRGDTTGGCKCRIGGRACHPQCGNCH